MLPKRSSASILLRTAVSDGDATPARSFPPVLTVAAATGALGWLALAPAASAQSNGFTGPYQLTDPAPTATRAGNWTVEENDPSQGGPYSVDVSNAPASVVLSIDQTQEYPGPDFLTLSNTAAGTGLVTFSWSTNSDASFDPSNNAADFFTVDSNGVVTYENLSTVQNGDDAGSASYNVSAGQTFGFRVVASYLGTESLTINTFSAPVPEPEPLAWMAAGATGLLLMRELRRRRRQAQMA